MVSRNIPIALLSCFFTSWSRSAETIILSLDLSMEFSSTLQKKYHCITPGMIYEIAILQWNEMIKHDWSKEYTKKFWCRIKCWEANWFNRFMPEGFFAVLDNGSGKYHLMKSILGMWSWEGNYFHWWKRHKGSGNYRTNIDYFAADANFQESFGAGLSIWSKI